MPKTPQLTHDASYRQLFSHPSMVKALLQRYVGQAWISFLDFSTLELVPARYVSKKHKQRESDLLWRLRYGPFGEWFYVYILIEHQSRPLRFMAVRMLSYVMLAYEELIRRENLGAHDQLPPVLPVVLYNGTRRWNAPVELLELIEPIGGGLEEFLPRFRFLVLDEAHLTSEQLGPLDNPVTAVFQLEQSEEIEEIREVVRAVMGMELGEDAEQLRHDIASWLRQVVLPAKLEDEELPEVKELEEVDEMLAERVKTWPKKWMAEGYQSGLREGEQKGEQKGRLEGLRESLSLLIERKFGRLSAAERRMVSEARQEQLTRWMERLLEASSPAEVFQS